MSEDFNIKISVRNGRLLKAIRARYDSVADLARKCHLHQSRVNSLVTMTVKPFNKNGWTDLALDVAAMVGKEPEYLWPDHLRELKLARSTSETEVGLDSVKKIIQDGTSEKSLSQISAISTLSKTLTPRERQCLAMRFAVGHTLDETARIFGRGEEGPAAQRPPGGNALETRLVSRTDHSGGSKCRSVTLGGSRRMA